MTEDLLTMRRKCVEAGQDTGELDSLLNKIFGEQSDPPITPEPKPSVKNSNQERDILNRAQRELEATQNLAIHLKDQVTDLESSKVTVEEQISAYRRVAESLQEQIDEVICESDETKNFETARLVRKIVSTVNGILREAYEVLKSLEARLESAIRIGDVAVDSAITLRRIADSLYNQQLRAAEVTPGTWKHSRTKQVAVENRHQEVTESKGSGNRAGWI
jgi:soluble cytochrome b562